MALRARGSSRASAAVPARESYKHEARARPKAAVRGSSSAGVWTRPSSSSSRLNQASGAGGQAQVDHGLGIAITGSRGTQALKACSGGEHCCYLSSCLLCRIMALNQIKVTRTVDHFQRRPTGTAGLPLQRRFAGRSSLTKEHAVTTASSPIETPGQTKTLA